VKGSRKVNYVAMLGMALYFSNMQAEKYFVYNLLLKLHISERLQLGEGKTFLALMIIARLVLLEYGF